MNYYMTTFTKGERIVERGWMLAATDRELVDYARTMGYGIDCQYLGRADMAAVSARVKARLAQAI